MEYTNELERNEDTAVTIGNFDGLHRGHQNLIHRVKALARQQGLRNVVFSFTPHPAAVLGKAPFYSILSLPEKIFLLEDLDVDVFLECPFDAGFSQNPPSQFMELLFSALRCRALVVGEGYRFGKGRAGTAQYMREWGAEHGMAVDIVSHVYDEEEHTKISSSRIRELILAGQMRKAEGMLSRPYFVMGEILQGKKIGRRLGFPTVNLMPPSFKILPLGGVYATKVFYDGKLWPGVTNVGKNPTVGGEVNTVETYILDFDRDIYGEQVRVYFYDRLRGEEKFDGVDALRAQIAKDVQAARRVFE